ncbi:biotin/lipoyl-containing protein [Fervidobacterium pennivorans subsp. shakshaketiis]|uniref:biotin/lipoyl-containing protein n=1 Tax=Fervidobacterium pennivorans TaxID=93466 RepID=UPI00143687B7|nr:biotin/lipoyl-containing protein [Fervidobacterium pennivorans]QIV78709.1 biotin/lipoyl-binding protein [Fervidobacterium pennivorans subsp. keratinolyticus]
MVRKFVVRVNGKEYIVEVEELGTLGTAAQAIQQTQIVEQPKPVVQQPVQSAKPTQPESKPAKQESTPVSTGSESGGGAKIVSPMSGVILKVLVSEGQKVEYGQKLVILEAMKMENDIVADKSGIVKKIHVKEGDNVDTGQVLVELE